MARLRVGDIEMDHRGLRVGTIPTPAPAPPTEQVPRDHLQTLVSQLPGRPVALISAGAALTFVTALTALLTWPSWLGSGWAVLGLGALVSLGLSVASAGTAKFLSTRTHLGRRSATDDVIYGERLSRMMPLLLGDGTSNTIANLARRTRMSEEVVTSTLLRAKQEGRISEELNLENGEWYYVAAPRVEHDLLEHLPLEERQMALEDRGKKTKRG